jgi:hypothetical protein
MCGRRLYRLTGDYTGTSTGSSWASMATFACNSATERKWTGRISNGRGVQDTWRMHPSSPGSVRPWGGTVWLRYVVGPLSRCTPLTQTDQPCTCNGFRAGDVLRSVKYQGKVVTGVVMCMCARHAFIRQGTVVDMAKGETSVNRVCALRWPSSSRHSVQVRACGFRPVEGLARVFRALQAGVHVRRGVPALR